MGVAFVKVPCLCPYFEKDCPGMATRKLLKILLILVFYGTSLPIQVSQLINCNVFKLIELL